MEVKSPRLLMVEDDPGDARLFQEMLRHEGAGSAITTVDRLSDALACLQQQPFDIVFCDLNLPDSQGLESFARLQSAANGLPIVILTGLDDEAIAVKAVQEGAQDYLVKNLIGGPLLGRALRYAIERKRIELQRDQLIKELRAALAKVKRLTGLLPMCAWCKKIRNDRGYWNEVGEYLRVHSEAIPTHGICPECMAKEIESMTLVGQT